MVGVLVLVAACKPVARPPSPAAHGPSNTPQRAEPAKKSAADRNVRVYFGDQIMVVRVGDHQWKQVDSAGLWYRGSMELDGRTAFILDPADDYARNAVTEYVTGKAPLQPD